MKSVISGTLPLSESHTTTNIVVWIKELVDEFRIKSDKVVAFVHDNYKNIEMLVTPWRRNMDGFL